MKPSSCQTHFSTFEEAATFATYWLLLVVVAASQPLQQPHELFATQQATIAFEFLTDAPSLTFSQALIATAIAAISESQLLSVDAQHQLPICV